MRRIRAILLLIMIIIVPMKVYGFTAIRETTPDGARVTISGTTSPAEIRDTISGAALTAANGPGWCVIVGSTAKCIMQSSGAMNYTASGPATASGSAESGGQKVVITGSVDVARAQCNNQCSLGAKECAGNHIRECITDANGCRGWGTPQSCGAGKYCQDSQCRQCSDQCVAGIAECIDNRQTRMCMVDSKGCKVWGNIQMCGANNYCQNGVCNQCENACYNDECQGELIRYCSAGQNGCMRLQPQAGCPAGQACQNNRCTDCNECQPGTAQCAGSNQYKICVKTGSCNKWSSILECGAGNYCQDSQCQQCNSQCSLGAKECAGTDSYKSCSTNADGCKVWGSTISSCGTEKICRNGECVCNNECSEEGKTECSGVSKRQCKKNPATGCMRWETTETCGSGEVCYNSNCCLPASCSAGECGQFTNNCGGTMKCTCRRNEICENNKCRPACTGECRAGERRCDGNYYQLCEKKDACAKWSEKKECPSGDICVAGVCEGKPCPNDEFSNVCCKLDDTQMWRFISSYNKAGGPGYAPIRMMAFINKFAAGEALC